MQITIGRSPECETCIPDAKVSRRHALLSCNGNGGAAHWTIEDLGSSNGTSVNGVKISKADLHKGDVVRVGSSDLIFDGERLQPKDMAGRSGVRLDAVGLWHYASGRADFPILRNVSFSVLPGEFLCIVGASGAGKSTLLKALCGYQPADDGAVLLDGDDLYAHYDAHRASIGYVPQEDIVHRGLSVESALLYAARLQFASDLTEDEIWEHLEKALAEVELTKHRTKKIGSLSGGERKRVSIAAELLKDPKLLFMDEPTSGLDPGLEKEFMHLCRRLSDGGRTVVLITHATANVSICNMVAFLAPGGRVAWYGPPDDALDHFKVRDFSDIYRQLSQSTMMPEHWEQKYLGSPAYATHVYRRLCFGQQPASLSRVEVRRRHSSFSQFVTLTSRYFAVMKADRTNLLIILAQAPIIALIICFLFPEDAFDLKGAPGHSLYSKTVLFLLAVSGIWFGTSSAAREIVKELPIYLRERMAVVSIPCYVLSKVAVLSVIALIQSAVLVWMVGARYGWFEVEAAGLLQMYGLCVLATVAGLAMGLAVSAVASSGDQAISLTPILLIAQMALSGGLISAREMTDGMDVISQATMARWALAGLGSVAGINKRLGPASQPMFDESAAVCAAALAGLTLICLLLTCGFLRRKDAL